MVEKNYKVNETISKNLLILILILFSLKLVFSI